MFRINNITVALVEFTCLVSASGSSILSVACGRQRSWHSRRAEPPPPGARQASCLQQPDLYSRLAPVPAPCLRKHPVSVFLPNQVPHVTSGSWRSSTAPRYSVNLSWERGLSLHVDNTALPASPPYPTVDQFTNWAVWPTLTIVAALAALRTLITQPQVLQQVSFIPP